MKAKVPRKRILTLGAAPVAALFIFGNFFYTEPADPIARDVLIYYANETAPNIEERKNYDIILGWLDKSPKNEAAILASQLRRDLTEFPRVVDTEVEIILNQEVFPAIVFTNRLAREGSALVKDVDKSAEKIAFDTADLGVDSSNYIASSNILSHKNIFAAALALSADRFPSPNFKFHLISKSHGDQKLMMMPRLRVMHEKVSAEIVTRLLAKGKSKPLADVDQTYLVPVSMSKREFMNAIISAGRFAKMHFLTIFKESCFSGPEGPIEQWFMPRNVDVIYAGVYKGLSYRNINYSEFIESVKKTSKMQQAFDIQLQDKLTRISK